MSVHGSTGSPRTGYDGIEINPLAVRPELVEGRAAIYKTVSMAGRKIHHKKDVVSGLCLLFLGLVLALLCFRLSVWKSGPQEGFFPLVIAVIIIGLSLLLLIQSVFLGDQEKEDVSVKKEKKVHLSRVLSYIIATLLFGILLESIGFLISSALLLVFILKVVEKRSWKITFALGLASVLISYILFAYLLGVPLPKGLIQAW
jgi:putative tricarboxylic transport membrane protein